MRKNLFVIQIFTVSEASKETTLETDNYSKILINSLKLYIYLLKHSPAGTKTVKCGKSALKSKYIE